MKNSRFLIASALLFLVPACTTIEQPKSTSRGYTSARLVKPAPKNLPQLTQSDAETNQAIQSALATTFRANGFRIDPTGADLTVAYLIILQDNATTKLVDDYFGYGRSSMQIADAAHLEGVVRNNRADYYVAGSIVIDIIDNKTGKLIYRDYATRDVTDANLSKSQRQSLIRSAVSQALAKFFRT